MYRNSRNSYTTIAKSKSMVVGRGEPWPPWILKFSQKGLIFSFEWENTNFATFGPPLEKSLSAPSRKNPSDAHG